MIAYRLIPAVDSVHCGINVGRHSYLKVVQAAFRLPKRDLCQYSREISGVSAFKFHIPKPPGGGYTLFSGSERMCS